MHLQPLRQQGDQPHQEFAVVWQLNLLLCVEDYCLPHKKGSVDVQYWASPVHFHKKSPWVSERVGLSTKSQIYTLIIQNCSNKKCTGDGNASDQSMIGEPRLDRARVSNACADQSIKARRNIQMERPQSIYLSKTVCSAHCQHLLTKKPLALAVLSKCDQNPYQAFVESVCGIHSQRIWNVC